MQAYSSISSQPKNRSLVNQEYRVRQSPFFRAAIQPKLPLINREIYLNRKQMPWPIKYANGFGTRAYHPFFRPDSLSIQGKCADCEEEEKISRKNRPVQVCPCNRLALTPFSHKVKNGKQQPRFMEKNFGYNFSDVRYNDQLRRCLPKIKCPGVYSGNHIVLGAGEYQPGT